MPDATDGPKPEIAKGVTPKPKKKPKPRRVQALADGARAAQVLVLGNGKLPRERSGKGSEAYLRRAERDLARGLGVGRVTGPRLPYTEEPEPEWSTPPAIETSGPVATFYPAASGERVRFDLALFEALNAEYAPAPKRTVAKATTYNANTLQEQARSRLTWVNRMVGLRGTRVLEVGCGNAFEVWHAAQDYDCDAFGVDVTEYATWQALSGPKVHLEMTDMAVRNPFPENYFDRIMSFTVWEHVRHPYRLLQEAFKVLKPGGVAWIRANLYAGTEASHRYKDVYFPWPHLLFSDEVLNEWDEKNGRPVRGWPWVNRLTWKHYEDYFLRVGFELRSVQFDQKPFDWAFYQRFEEQLSRWPRWDLSTDYFLAVVQKPFDAA